jgi:hypothetical protein
MFHDPFGKLSNALFQALESLENCLYKTGKEVRSARSDMRYWIKCSFILETAIGK